MKAYTLEASERKETGKKVKHLRAQGTIPATVYGKNIPSNSVSVGKDAFVKVYDQAGETGLVELALGSKKLPVLIHTVQLHPVDDEVLHIEFHQVDLAQRVHAKVPVVVIGESPAVAQKLGVLLTVLNDIEVEALPAELPEKIEVDVTMLAVVDQELKVSDMKVRDGVKILTDGSLTVVKVGSLVTKEAEAAAVAEQEAAQAAKQDAAPSADGEQKQPSDTAATTEKSTE